MSFFNNSTSQIPSLPSFPNPVLTRVTATAGAQPNATPGNTLPTALNSASVFSGTKAAQFQENPLNAYDQVAYHFQLSVNGDPVTVGMEGLSENPIIIVESGVTGYNIKSVHIEAIVSPNKVTRNSFATKIEITVQEAGGCSFLDSWVRACNVSNVSNYNKAQYILKFWFKGYDLNENPMTLPNIGPWSLPIIVTECAMHSTESGTTYVLTAMPYNDVAMTDEKFRFKELTEIEGNTVAELLQSISDKANAIIKKRYGDQVYTYSFVFDDDEEQKNCSKYSWSQISADTKQSWKWLSDAKNPRMTIAGGTAMLDVVNSILRAMPDAQKDAKTDASKVGNSTTPDGVRKTYNIYPEVIQGEYWFPNNFYKETINYHIRGYITAKARTQTDKIDSSLTLQWCMKNLKKQYNYYFTGENTEILSFDVKSNFAWQLAVPKYQGNIYSALGRETGPIYDPNADDLSFDRLMKKETNDAQKAELTQAHSIKQQEGGAANRAIQAKSTAARAQLWVNPSPQMRYAEEIPPSIPQTIATWVQSESANMAESGTTVTDEPSSTMYGAILDQMMSPQMMSISLTVRGDPYWIGFSVPFSYAIATSKAAPDQAVFANMENYISLVFRSPTTDANGKVTVNSSDVFDGIYSVNSITHRFDNGEYKQVLHATRNPYITASDSRTLTK